MKIPRMEGMIKRRMLINFRIDADVMRKSLPAPFRPKLHQGWAIDRYLPDPAGANAPGGSSRFSGILE